MLPIEEALGLLYGLGSCPFFTLFECLQPVSELNPLFSSFNWQLNHLPNSSCLIFVPSTRSHVASFTHSRWVWFCEAHGAPCGPRPRAGWFATRPPFVLPGGAPSSPGPQCFAPARSVIPRPAQGERLHQLVAGDVAACFLSGSLTPPLRSLKNSLPSSPVSASG